MSDASQGAGHRTGSLSLKDPSSSTPSRQPPPVPSDAQRNRELELYTRTELDAAVRQALAAEKRKHEEQLRRASALIGAYRAAFNRVCRELQTALVLETEAFTAALKFQYELERQLGTNLAENSDAVAVLALLQALDRLNRDDYAAVLRGEVPPRVLEPLKKLLPSDD